MLKKIKQETADILLKINAITIRPRKPFKYNSGILSPIYIDNRLIISCPEVRKKIINFYIKVIQKKIGLDKIDLLSGTSTAAIPHAAFLAQKLDLPMVYVRGSKKEHGKENQIEGKLKKGQRVLVIEDHISTGGSLIENAEAIKKAGGKVENAVAITTYLMKTAKQKFKKCKIEVDTLTDFKIIVERAIINGYIKEEDKKSVLDWAQDPKNWGRKFGFE